MIIKVVSSLFFCFIVDLFFEDGKLLSELVSLIFELSFVEVLVYEYVDYVEFLGI